MLRAGILYGVVIFALGFVLGSLREWVLAPMVGRGTVVWIEVPLLLLASWFASGWLIRRFQVAPAFSARIIMGCAAFCCLMIGEALVAIHGFGRTLAMHLSGYMTARGALELAPQIAFALLPLLQKLRESRS